MNAFLKFINQRLELIFFAVVALPLLIGLCLQILLAVLASENNLELFSYTPTVFNGLRYFSFFGCLVCFLLNVVSKRHSKIIYIVSIIPLAFVLGAGVLFLAIAIAGRG